MYETVMLPQFYCGFSALQRAEIAEIDDNPRRNNPRNSFSALQRAEIAEIVPRATGRLARDRFQCSSTSRNC